MRTQNLSWTPFPALTCRSLVKVWLGRNGGWLELQWVRVKFKVALTPGGLVLQSVEVWQSNGGRKSSGRRDRGDSAIRRELNLKCFAVYSYWFVMQFLPAKHRNSLVRKYWPVWRNTLRTGYSSANKNQSVLCVLSIGNWEEKANPTVHAERVFCFPFTYIHGASLQIQLCHSTFADAFLEVTSCGHEIVGETVESWI